MARGDNLKGLGGPGRPKGTVNKVTGEIREMIVQALDKAGGADYLYEQSIENPVAFMTLVGKVLPLQLKNDASAPFTIVIQQNDAAI